MLHYSRIDNMFYGHTSLDIAFWFFQAAIYNRVVRWTRLKGTQSISSGRAWMYNLTVLKIYPLYKRYTITMINLIFTFFFFFAKCKAFNVDEVHIFQCSKVTRRTQIGFNQDSGALFIILEWLRSNNI